MGSVFYTSDWHFNHDFVARLRGFADAEEHDEALIAATNKTVTKRDQLWVLGDVFMGSVTKGLEKISRLNGTKHIVLGNHDAPYPSRGKSHNQMRRFLEVFESIHLHEQHVIDGHKVLLSHTPYEGDHADREDRYVQWRLPDMGLPLLHGHVHDEWEFNGRQFNVGVDHNFAPVPVDRVSAWLKSLEESNS
jgi:calcineurin-like phosphoesterase family protein